MATATAPARTAAKKTVTKPTAKKKATSTTTAAKVVTKPSARKKAAAKRPAAKASGTKVASKTSVTKAPPTPVTLNGEAAKNRHFLVDRDLFEQTVDRCAEDGIVISDVMRHGLARYGKKAPSEEAMNSGPPVLPRAALAYLKKTYKSGETARVNEFLAACHRAGWTVQSLADSMVAAGVVEKISRQAVSLRVLKAPEQLSADLPPVPELGLRRVMSSPRKGKTKGQFAAAGKKAKRQHAASTYDLAFRIADADYELAARRAKHEHAMMSRVLDEVMVDYLSGAYDKALGSKTKGPDTKTARTTATKKVASKA